MENFINYTLGSFLDKVSDIYPNNEAIVYIDCNIRMTYKEFNNYCNKVSKGLISIGIKKGDKVSVWAENYPEWLALIFATAKIGAILVTVNTDYKKYELEYLLKQSDTHTLFMSSGSKNTNYVEIIKALVDEVEKNSLNIENTKFKELKNIVFIPKNTGEKVPDNFTSFNSLIEMGKDISDEALSEISKTISPFDVTNIQYTSGTTGRPKGVMLTHYNILNNAKFIGDSMKLTEKDRLCISVPFFHCFGLVLSILACVTHGSTMIPTYHFSPTKVFEAIEKEKCTAVNGVPAMFKIMLDHDNFKNTDFSSLRTGIMAGDICPRNYMERVNKEMNMSDIIIVYGQTEASPGITRTTVEDDIDIRVSTVGKSFPTVEVKIIDCSGNELEDYMEGEICTRGYNVTKGYYKDIEATNEAIDKDGWLHTGDIAVRDNEGNYTIIGRKKDVIIRGGENIYPKEIEEYLKTNEKIKDAQIIGIPSLIHGEDVVACIIKENDVEISEDEIINYVNENMAKHKVPTKVFFFEKFPTTASGKTQKYILKEIIKENLNNEIIEKEFVKTKGICHSQYLL